MINIEIDKVYQDQIQRSILTHTAENTLNFLSVPKNASLSIQITTDQHIQALNQKYRHYDHPTDVLAFPAGHTDPDDGSMYLGDVIISFPRAEIQAEQRGHPVIQEIQLLIIHGILHLCGFDHADPEGKQSMWHMKSQILTKLGIDTRVLIDL